MPIKISIDQTTLPMDKNKVKKIRCGAQIAKTSNQNKIEMPIKYFIII